jgi:energy-coupling factor transport system ATP-binding protein
VKAVEIEDLHWRYPAFVGEENPWALQGVDLRIEQGEYFGITGTSGAGKTTICKFILGLIPHAVKIPLRRVNHHLRGRVSVLGEPVTVVDPGANPHPQIGEPLGAIARAGVMSPRVGMVFQDPENQFLRMSLLHEVAYGLQILRLPREEIESRVQEALAMVGLQELWPVAEYLHPADLSGGQKQRVAIASFLAMRPEILILDEPTSDLDPVGKHEVVAATRRLKQLHNLTVILVEQDPEILASFCDRVALVSEGRVELVSPVRKFYSNMGLLSARGIYTFEVSRIAQVAHLPLTDDIPLSVEEAVRVFPRQLDAGALPADPPPNQELLIAVEDLWFRYEDGTVALKGADLKLHRGDFLALLGNNGSGKTTLAKVLNGIYRPWKGNARILGQDISLPRVRAQLPRSVGYVFQNPDHQIFTRRVYDEVAYGLRNTDVPAEEMHTRVAEALEAVDLLDKQDEDPLFLGKGQRQRLAVASILAMKPEILIVDEPTTGQDFRMVTSIARLLQELHAQGRTILIITHDMTLAANYCKQAAVMLDGKTVFHGTPRELFSNSEVVRSTGLRVPQAIALSCALRAEVPGFPLLLNVAEWLAALSGQPAPARAGGSAA